MGDPLAGLADQYRERFGAEIRSKEGLRRLYDGYVRRREASILDAAAATAALNALFLSDQFDASAATPQMQEAFNLAFPNHTIDELNGLGPESAQGWLSAWKGKYFEVVVVDKLNAGEAVGDIQLGPGQIARLAESPSQPGWDLQILNADGAVAQELQLKATSSLSYVKEALEKYPDIDIVATDEVASQMSDIILSSGMSNADLEAQVTVPVEELLDGPWEELVETVLPGLPFVLIAAAEGTKVLMGRQTLQRAVHLSLERGTKTGTAMGVGALAMLVGAGVVSLPATFLTRIGIDRYRILSGLSRRLSADTAAVQSVAAALPKPSSAENLAP